MGLMHNSTHTHELFSWWAFSIIYVYGGVDTLTAFSLNDNEQALRYGLYTIPLFFWAGWLGSFSLRWKTSVIVPLLVLYLMAICNVVESYAAFFMAGKSNGLPQAIWPVIYYMRYGRHVPEEHRDDHTTITRYRYLVLGDKTINSNSWYSSNLPTNIIYANIIYDNIITMEEIWNSEGALLQSNNESNDVANHIKNTCLSFALSRLLLTRFAGFTMDVDSMQNTRNFVEIELLGKNSRLCEFNRVFRVVELELEFVFDFFYTKLSCVSYMGFAHKLRRLGCVACFLWFAFYGLRRDNPTKDNLGIMYHGHGLEVGVTRAFALIIVLLELWQINIHVLSNWEIVKRVCEYVKEPNSHPGKCKEMELRCIWTIKNFLSKQKFLSFFFKPWQRKLGQYSLMQNCRKVPIMYKLEKAFGWFIRVSSRVGQSGEFYVTLSVEVKKAIVLSLKSNGLALSRGMATLERHELLAKFSYACKSDMNAEVILVWHIATSACGFFNPDHLDEHFHVATQLSNYCAYLVTFVFDLLPDHPYSTTSVFDTVVDKALVIKGLSLDQRYQWLMAINEEDTCSVFGKGAALAKKLMSDVVGEPSKGWRVLAEFWAELLLYMAPSNNENAHGECLAKGGEFITHLWALLTHASIVNRESFTSTD